MVMNGGMIEKIVQKKLNKNYITVEPMSLADIYNIDVELFKTEDKTSKIGF